MYVQSGDYDEMTESYSAESLKVPSDVYVSTTKELWELWIQRYEMSEQFGESVFDCPGNQVMVVGQDQYCWSSISALKVLDFCFTVSIRSESIVFYEDLRNPLFE